MESNKENKGNIQAHYPEPVSREAVIHKLAEEGMMLTVDKLEDVTDASIIAAFMKVVDNLRNENNKLLRMYTDIDNENRSWYRAAAKANMNVSRSNREIVLKPMFRSA